MKFTDYTAVGVIGFLAGWLLRPRQKQPKPPPITVFFQVGPDGQLTKDVFPRESPAWTESQIEWTVTNRTQNQILHVEVIDFLDKPSKRPKWPLKQKKLETTVSPGETGKITATVKKKAMFDDPPVAPRDELGRYQDFLYGFMVNKERFDPEIRIRER